MHQTQLLVKQQRDVREIIHDFERQVKETLTIFTPKGNDMNVYKSKKNTILWENKKMFGQSKYNIVPDLKYGMFMSI